MLRKLGVFEQAILIANKHALFPSPELPFQGIERRSNEQ